MQTITLDHINGTIPITKGDGGTRHKYARNSSPLIGFCSGCGLALMAQDRKANDSKEFVCARCSTETVIENIPEYKPEEIKSTSVTEDELLTVDQILGKK